MSEMNLYQVLGVAPSATADQIKTAYRELVKRYHPDLFSARAEKDAATEKLRVINEAYAVLGNAAKRLRYDETLTPKATPHVRSATGRSRRRAAPPRPPRRGAKPALKQRKLTRFRIRVSKRAAGYGLGAALLLAIVAYGAKSEPVLVPAWTLFEKLEFSPASDLSGGGKDGPGWVGLAQYPSMAECAEILKAKVRADELEGSRAVYDEKSGAMAITVYVRKDQAVAEARDTPPKRVRSLECRSTPRIAAETGFRRILKSVSLD